MNVLFIDPNVRESLRSRDSVNDNDGVPRAQVIEFRSMLRVATSASVGDGCEAEIIAFRSIVNGPDFPPQAA